MAQGGLNLCLAVVILAAAMLITRTSAQSGCTMAIIGLAPCLNYITGNTSTPASSCCSQLTSVVQSNPRCLCSLLNGGGSSFGINVNQTLALALPGACNVQTPPVSQCNVIDIVQIYNSSSSSSDSTNTVTSKCNTKYTVSLKKSSPNINSDHFKSPFRKRRIKDIARDKWPII
ncbi:hypothetical protein QJS04_geneDACA021144 [Acorus gramineus]|uniref:Bifunctional inhibitor/plant lipid transfer protein/seed storage helical domain-containing protein n=1 Tax=Acorus gramineus TaxID=55184 RepID=A0AAV9AE15_ACOGR|nr:hypothetical protein QJS04_geneDACA021144 [Acorus gramineus]